MLLYSRYTNTKCGRNCWIKEGTCFFVVSCNTLSFSRAHGGGGECPGLELFVLIDQSRGRMDSAWGVLLGLTRGTAEGKSATFRGKVGGRAGDAGKGMLYDGREEIRLPSLNVVKSEDEDEISKGEQMDG